ncbi:MULTISPECIES: alpha/beta hydrolase [Rhodomicrobium]|uniref:alpha/beta hydrolase n=1 Tax=Rhodomicrobium TaxID=1068 RepID=UPI001FD96BCB|nr:MULTISPECIES: alpha/beta hydrolase [Rhodomicrobium]
MTQGLLIVALGLVGLYVAAAFSLYMLQRRLIYFPDSTYYTPEDEGLTDVREVKLDTPDGERVIAWWSRAAKGQPTLIYFHGNAGNLVDASERLKMYANVGLGVFMPSYRGYSGSSGRPSETALVADALLAYDYLRKQGLPASDIIPYGESLGTGVAVQLAAARPVGALILDAPYTSLPDVGKLLYPIMPVQTFMVDRFESKRHIAGVKAPILIMHGTADRTVPFSLGKQLFDLAPEPKQMAVLNGAGHSDIYNFGALARLRAFIAKYRQKPEAR